MLSKIVAAKALAALGTVTLGATGAAAASGTLPEAAQNKVAALAEHVGVDLPDTASDTANAVRAAIDGSEPGKGRGEAVSTAARGDHGKPDTDDASSVATDEGDENSADGRARAEAGADNGLVGQDKADEAKPTGAGPGFETPATGGLDTADAASEGANDAGADKANDAAAQGSANGRRR